MKNKLSLVILLIVVTTCANAQQDEQDSIDGKSISFNNGLIRFGMTLKELKHNFPKGVLKKEREEEYEAEGGYIEENRFYFSKKSYGIISYLDTHAKVQRMYDIVILDDKVYLDPFKLTVGDSIAKLKKHFPNSYVSNNVEKKIIENSKKKQIRQEEAFFVDIKPCTCLFKVEQKEYFIIWYNLSTQKVTQIERMASE